MYYKVCHNEWHKKLFYTNNCMGNYRSPRLGILGSNLISDSYAAIFLYKETIIKQKMRFCRLEHYNNKATTINM
jgi:hypothetical protein